MRANGAFRRTVAAILPAAGRGERLGSRTPKPLVRIGALPLFIRTVRAIKGAYPFTRIVCSCSPELEGIMRKALDRHGLSRVELVKGGRTRSESVRNALELLGPGDQWVLVHDAARPFVQRSHVRSVILSAFGTGAGILAQRATATVKEAGRGGTVSRTLKRNRIFLAQTPQVVRADILRKAYRRLGRRALAFTDEAGLVEAIRRKVAIVEGPPTNIKITTPEDIRIAEAILGKGRI